MLIELNKDPLFLVTQSPIKAIKEKEIQRKKEMRERRINPRPQKREVDIEVINPLPGQLRQHKKETSIKMSVETSKASESLKKYVIQQERNLRCLRLDRIAPEEKLNTSRLKSLTFNVTQVQDQQKAGKEIHIPRIEDLFKNQSKEILIYENQSLQGQLGKMIQRMDDQIVKTRNRRFSHTREIQSPNTLAKKRRVYHFEDDEKTTENKLQKSKELRERLYKEKREMMGRAPGENSKSTPANNMSFFLREIEKPKEKRMLEGVRTYSYKDGKRDLNLTMPSILLFEMNNLNKQKQKKEYELTGLLKNSFQNRDSILRQKQSFYESQNPFNELSPSKQFQLRKVMNKKLNHRLEISKEQVNKFIAYLYEVKNYHVILNDTILQILNEVRETLLRGKVMKLTDFQSIILTKRPEDLRGHPNDLIVKTLTEMMI